MSSAPVLRSLGLRHVALKVRDLERSLGFYRDLLGFAVIWRPDPQNAYLSSGCDNLALHVVEEAPSGGALDHLGILVATPEEVRSAEEALRSRSVPILQGTKTHRDGSVSCYMADPDGNSVQVLFEPKLSRQELHAP